MIIEQHLPIAANSATHCSGSVALDPQLGAADFTVSLELCQSQKDELVAKLLLYDVIEMQTQMPVKSQAGARDSRIIHDFHAF